MKFNLGDKVKLKKANADLKYQEEWLRQSGGGVGRIVKGHPRTGGVPSEGMIGVEWENGFSHVYDIEALDSVAPATKENGGQKMTQFKVGDKVQVKTDVPGTLEFYKGKKGTIVAVDQPGEDSIAIAFDFSRETRYAKPHQLLLVVGEKKVKKDPITVDPYQFAKFFSVCDGWKATFQQKTWVGAWKAGMEKHGGAKEMCDWLKSKGGNCVCGKGFAQWKKEAERVLEVKLVDHRSFIDRIRGKK